MVLLKLGGSIIGLTAGHVADAIIKHVRGDDICQVGAARLLPQTLIERHPQLDLASFALDEQTVHDSNHKAFLIREIPLHTPSQGDDVIFGGYPGSLRDDRGEQYDNAFVWVAGRLETVSENNMGMKVNLKESCSVETARVRSNAALGGISGGPVFRVTPAEVEGLFAVKVELVGIVHECTRMKLAREYTLVRAHRLTTLQPDGRFQVVC